MKIKIRNGSCTGNAEEDDDQCRIECPLCYVNYESSGKCSPIVLPCGHSLCVECSGHYAQELAECPLCKATFNGTLGFKKNYQLSDCIFLLNNLDSRRGEENKPIAESESILQEALRHNENLNQISRELEQVLESMTGEIEELKSRLDEKEQAFAIENSLLIRQVEDQKSIMMKMGQKLEALMQKRPKQQKNVAVYDQNAEDVDQKSKTLKPSNGENQTYNQGAFERPFVFSFPETVKNEIEDNENWCSKAMKHVSIVRGLIEMIVKRNLKVGEITVMPKVMADLYQYRDEMLLRMINLEVERAEIAEVNEAKSAFLLPQPSTSTTSCNEKTTEKVIVTEHDHRNEGSSFADTASSSKLAETSEKLQSKRAHELSPPSSEIDNSSESEEFEECLQPSSSPDLIRFSSSEQLDLN